MSPVSQWKPYTQTVTLNEKRCPDLIDRHEAAVRTLLFQPNCTDAAVTYLTRLSEENDEVLADLAAAHLLRAERQDRPIELLEAYRAANLAVGRNPRSPAALYNRALVLEKLGLTADAIDAWNAYLAAEKDSQWLQEAREHLRKLSPTPAQWPHNREEIRAALRQREARRVAHLIDPFPSAALRFFEGDLLLGWAKQPTPERRAELELFAEVLSRRLNGDRYAIDVVRALSDTEELREGIRRFVQTRSHNSTFDQVAAISEATSASALLRRASNPLYLAAELDLASARAVNGDPAAVSSLEPIERSGYPHLVARARILRGYVDFRGGRYLDALKAGALAGDSFGRLRDAEGQLAARVRKAGIYRTMGHHETALRECLTALSGVQPESLKERHNVIGESASVALALGHPAVALLYQNTIIRELRERLAQPEDVVALTSFRRNLGIALNTRGVIHLRLGQFNRASDDLAEAIRLAERGDSAYLTLLQARISETEGRAQLERGQRQQAIASFTRALNLIPPSEQRTFRAELLAQRALARGSGENAKRDLQSALDELRIEERHLLESRERGEGEDLWPAYFARFSDTYAHLIRYLFENHSTDEAFQYAERERAYETVDLILKRNDVPQAFRDIASGELVDVDKVRRLIPTGTLLIQYRVLEDRTYAWVLSRDRFVPRILRVGRGTIERWTSDLQSAALANDATAGAFLQRLYAPYRQLIAPLLDGFEKPQRLVFIPDGAIHGLPLAALREPGTDQFLIERAPIEVAGSTLLYLFSMLRDRELARTAPSALVVGDPDFDTTLGFARNRLPAAEREARRIHALYAPRAVRLLGKEATIPAFLRGAANATIVHIAAHAIANTSDPSRSLILLAPSNEDRGALMAADLVGKLTLRSTRLVVLSACSSAGGGPVGPEGVAPLVRPLIAAGVPAVAGSLWDVRDDATTETLLVSFHQRYGRGEDAALAMQHAQLEALKAPDPRSVLAWAAFQVIGHASSPFAAPRNGGTDIGTVHSANFLQRPHGLHSQ